MSMNLLRAFRLCLMLVAALPAVTGAVYYGNTPTSFAWVDPIAGGHTAAVWTNGASCTAGTYGNAPLDDDITAPIIFPGGFQFNFGGVLYDRLQIMANGRLQFNNGFCGYGTVGPVTSPPTYPYDFPTGNPLAGNVVRMMRIYGADFDPGGSLPGGAVYYAMTGTAPNRSFVVTWYNIKEWNNPGSLFNMQIILRENGDFVYQYKDTFNITTGHAQIGWEVSATDYDIYLYSGFGSLAYSAVRFYPAPVKTGEWRMDELSWSNAAGQVLDTSGSGYHAQRRNGAQTANATPAISTNPGTCRYGAFDGDDDHVLLPASFPNMTTSFTITAWIRTQDRARITPQRILIDDGGGSSTGYGLSLGDAGAGTLRFYNRGSTPANLDTAAVIQNNLWYFVAAVIDIAGGTRSIYVYDASGALLTSVSAAFTGWSTDNSRVTIGGDNSAASGSPKFLGDIDEVKVYQGAVPQSILDVLARETHLCRVEGVTLGGFNVFESSTTTGFVTGYIKTKTAGRRFNTTTGNLAIVALSGGAIDNTFNNTVKIEFVNASAGGTLDANGCNAAWPVVATLANQTVSGGRVNLNPVPQINGVAYPNLKVRVSFPATGTVTRQGCSNDAFALRPDRLVITGPTHVDWQTPGAGSTMNNLAASGGEVHKAGRNFTMSATARDALGTTIATYAGSPSGGVSAMWLPSGCAACVPGVLTTGGWSGTGTLVTNSANYSEAGSIATQLEDRSFSNVDIADSSPGERYVDSHPLNAGRFVPDHFDVAQLVAPQFRTFNATDAQCSAGAAPRRTFTYIGQPFGYVTRPQATVIARNFAGATTINYLGSLWKVGAGAVATAKDCTTTPNTCVYTSTFGASGGTVAENYTYALTPAATPGWDNSVTAPAAATVTSNNNGTGTITFAAGAALAFQRSLTTPQTAFTAAVNNSVRVTDNSEAAGVITTTTPADFNAISFDAGNQFYYGRLRLENAYGSTLISMPLPLKAQRWNGTAFVTNDVDNCTTIAAGNIAIGNPLNGLTAAMVSPPTVGGAFSAGTGSLRLPAPTGRQSGSVDVSINLGTSAAGASCTTAPAMPASTGANLAHLRGLWCTPPGNYSSDPTARATFGLYRGANPFIYQRENFQ